MTDVTAVNAPNGSSRPDLDAGLAAFNTASDDVAAAGAASCCPWEPFVARLVAGRPYRSVGDLETVAAEGIDAISDQDLPEVLTRHPQIGVDSGHATLEADWSRGEESGVRGSAERTRADLLAEGTRYHQVFGYTYVVSAAGRSGEEILADLRQRLHADPAPELQTARAELRQICRSRAVKLLTALADPT